MKISLRTNSGMGESLGNLGISSNNGCSIVAIEDACEEAADAVTLAARLNSLKLCRKFAPDKTTDTKIRLKCTDYFGNVSWLEVIKDVIPETRPIKVVVHIENGLVTGVYASNPNVNVEILDMDDTERNTENEAKEILLEADIKCGVLKEVW